jgi:hypothetical protein
MKSLQCGQKGKPVHSSFARHRDKGISSLIGITLFIIIFTVAMIYIFAWTQSTSSYADVVKNEIDYEQQRAAEMLQVLTIDQSAGQSTINMINPTSHLIVVRQVWSSSHSQVWNGNVSIQPFSNYVLSSLPSIDGNFKVITLRGNIFYSTFQINEGVSTTINQTGHWDVEFWVGATNSSIPIIVGNSTWYELSFSRVYGRSVGWGAQSYNQTFGFWASTHIKPSNGSNNINISVSLISPGESANSMTILLANSSGSYLIANFTSSNFAQFNVNPNSKYYIQINYMNYALSPLPQTITVTIVGADFA